MGLASLLNRKPLALSGGEKQRTAVARAIVRNPKVFLLDEPLSDLDAPLRVEYVVKSSGYRGHSKQRLFTSRTIRKRP